MRAALVTIALLALALPARAQPSSRHALEAALRAGPVYAAREHALVLGEVDALDRAIRAARPGACRGFASRRRDALVEMVARDPGRAPRVWAARRRIVAGLAECARGRVSMSDESLRAELASWLAREGDPPPPVPTAGTAARDLAARARAHARAGRIDEARAGLAATREAARDDAILVSDSLRELGRALVRASLREGRTLLEEAVARAAQAGEVGRRAQADALLDLGDSHARARDFPAALVEYDRALALRAALVGDRDPWVAEIESARAVALRELGRFDDAIAAHERALLVRRTALAMCHPDALASLSSVAAMRRASGELEVALGMHGDLLVLREDVLGPDDPQIAVTLDAIATSERQLGRYADAEPHARRAIDVRAHLPQGHPDRGRSHAVLAEVLIAVDRPDEAIEAAERHLELAIEAHGAHHAEVARAWALLARIAERARDPGLAQDARDGERSAHR